MIMHATLSIKKRGMHESPALLSDGVLASGIAPSREYVVGGEVHDLASKVQWMAEGDRCAWWETTFLYIDRGFRYQGADFGGA